METFATTLGDVLTGALTGGPDGDLLTDPSITGVRSLPADNANGKHLILINEIFIPSDEKYLGPLPRRVRSGQKPDPGLCRRCRRLSLVRHGEFTSNKNIKNRPFGTWFQLLLRARRSICRLIVVALSCGTFYLHPLLASIDPEVQLTQLCPETLSSGENVLAVEYGLRRFGYLRIVTRENFREILRQAYEVKIDSPFELLEDDNSVFHDKSGQVASLAIVRNWISDCEQHHGSTCREFWRQGHTRKFYPIILIDVEDRCLIRANISNARYFTLSYVWGRAAIPMTTRTNFAQRQTKLKLPSELPKTIEDAILVLKGLNERYLWVDALCIIQDDPTTKHSDIQMMDFIYNHSTATIVALYGRNADAGLPGVRPGSRPPQRIECPQLQYREAGMSPSIIEQMDRLAKEDPEKHEHYLSNYNIAVSSVEGYNALKFMANTSNPNADLELPEAHPIYASAGMVAHPPSLKHALDCHATTTWNTRAWTLQERLLSRRCIYFSYEYVYFQCGKHTISETGGNLLTWADVQFDKFGSNPSQRSDAQQTNPLLHFRKPPPTQMVVQDDMDEDGGILVKQDWDVYAEVIGMYSKRNLSFAKDTLHAITGILAVMHDRIGGQMIAGLPTKYFDLALLWNSAEAHDRSTPFGQGGNIFPSWSWAAWTGYKEYRLTEDGCSTYNSLRTVYTTSEIDRFTIYHRGSLIEIQKSAEAMKATEIRSLGRKPGPPPYKKLEQEFPRYIPYSDHLQSKTHGPDFGPNVLQFWTYAVTGQYFTFASLKATPMNDPEHGNIPGKLGVTAMCDPAGKQCGLIVSVQTITRRPESIEMIDHLEWILLSSFGDTDQRRGGIETMDSRLRPFDERAFPWEGEGSGLVNVMLIQWFHEVAERITIAQVHRVAWEKAGPVFKHIRLC